MPAIFDSRTGTNKAKPNHAENGKLLRPAGSTDEGKIPPHNPIGDGENHDGKDANAQTDHQAAEAVRKDIEPSLSLGIFDRSHKNLLETE